MQGSSNHVEQFKNFVYAVGERSVPNGICIFGLSGGHERWTIISLPRRMLRLSLREQLAKSPLLMTRYRRRFSGSVPFFGALVGFRFCTATDTYEFDATGRLVRHVRCSFRPPPITVQLQ